METKTDKVCYDREMQGYIPPKSTKGAGNRKDPNAPKRPPGAFFVFCVDHRPKIKGDNPGIGIGDIAKELGKLWVKLSPEEKAPHEAKAAKLKEKYDEDMAAYRAKSVKMAAPVMDEDDDEEDDEEDDDEDDD